ncbi:hypothetical protein [Paenibacillus sp. NPDC058174]|uniref:hypothetical protein n=1 Tax=Paenibacillus sp. NPDC058174 TaxID=3346366 RepID=UPI0036DF33D2
MAISYGTQVWGTADLNGDIVIGDNNNSFAFNVDDSLVSIIIPQGTYKGNRDHFVSDIISLINTEVQAVNNNVFVRLGGVHLDNYTNVLIIEHNDKNNSHSISNFAGTAMSTIFGSVQFSLAPRTV